MRSKRALRRVAREALAGLNLDLPLDASQLCERYGARRGRPIKAIAHPLPAGSPSGVWLAADDADYFFHQANTSRLHRDQIIIHEFGHLIAGHQAVGGGALGRGISVSDDEMSEALNNTCYADEREWEAEVIASVIMEWAAVASVGIGHTATDDGMRGLQRMLGGHRGWL